MIGLLIILIISWGLLYLIERKHIDAIGIIPSRNRLLQFIIGLLFIQLIVLISIFVESQVLSIEWCYNQDFKLNDVLNAFIYHLRSALTEDLMYRGAILFILIQRLGYKWAILISALVFGVYHVFSYGMTNESVIPIIYVILVTGFTGYVWAYAFYKTRSIWLGLGFHLGYNLLMSFFFESQPFGQLIFEQVSRTEISEWNNLYLLLFKGLFPSVMTLIFLKISFKYVPVSYTKRRDENEV